MLPIENLAPPLAVLIGPALRRQVPAKVNDVTLEVQGVPKEPTVGPLVSLMAWADQRMRSESRETPGMDLGLDVASQTSDNTMGG